MPRRNRIEVTRPDLARVLAILDSHSKWPHRRIHHLDLRKALEQARIVAPEEVPADVVTLDSLGLEIRISFWAANESEQAAAGARNARD